MRVIITSALLCVFVSASSFPQGADYGKTRPGVYFGASTDSSGSVESSVVSVMQQRMPRRVRRLDWALLASDAAVRTLDIVSTRRALTAPCRCNHEMFLPGLLANHTPALAAFEDGMLILNYEIANRMRRRGHLRRATAVIAVDVAVVAPWAIHNLFLRS